MLTSYILTKLISRTNIKTIKLKRVIFTVMKQLQLSVAENLLVYMAEITGYNPIKDSNVF